MIRWFFLLLILVSCKEDKTLSLKIDFNYEEISKEKLKEDYSFLSESDFSLKFTESIKTPLDFFRSYPITFYKDSKLIGDFTTALCYGDPHFENFGFINFEKETRYVFNDLDDSGICPLPLDALRYFTSLYFFSFSHRQIEGFITNYNVHYSNELTLPSLSKPLQVNLEKKRLKNLKKYTAQNKFIKDKDFLPLSIEVQQRIEDPVTQKFPNIKVQDSVFYSKQGGGSSGLKRYWLLIKNESNKQDIIELKERRIPATRFSTTTTEFLGLKTLAQLIWGRLPISFEELDLEGTSYQIRSRTKDDINLAKIPSNLRSEVINLQTALMAKLHKEAAKDDQAVSNDWYIKSSKVIAQRYLQAFEELKNKN